MTQTIGMELTSDPEPAALCWREIPNLRSILTGLIERNEGTLDMAETTPANIGNLALDAVA